ncbi:MAG TPA: hypothetical protein VHB25_17435 [Gemmatimonadaceae bacterium]|nr:hypothetical protein [Gemmatimonadaceae bacterium]
MGIYLDEPLAAMAAAALTIGGGVLGAWWQRRRSAPRAKPPDDAQLLDARFNRLEEIVEATALEVERIGEGQRFTTRLLAEGRSASAPSARAPERPPGYRTPH